MSFVNIDYPFDLTYTQSKFDLTTNDYFYKYEHIVNGFFTSKVVNRSEFVKWYNKCDADQRFFYELLPHNRRIREYYDIDLSGTFTPEELENESVKVIQTLLDIRNLISSVKCSPKDFIVLEDNRPNKLSLHLISKKTFYSSNHIQKKFVECLNNLLLSYNACFTLDASVYYRNKLFRLFKSCKRKYQSPLKLFKPLSYSFAQMEDTFLLIDSCNGMEEMHITNDEDDQKVYESEYKSMDTTTDNVTKEHFAILEKWLVEHPEFEVKDNRLNRVARTCCFIDKNDMHSKENAFWHVKNNRVYVGCFTHTKSICINLEKCESIECEPTVFNHTTHSVDYLEQLSNYGSFKSIFMKIPFGGGKTTRSLEYALATFDRVLVISHRITLIRDMSRRFGFASYCDNDFTSDKLVCCINSLPKLTDPGKYDIIIIDEIHSCLRQTTMKSQDMRLATSFFIKMLENTSRVVIGMDGNLSNSDMDFIKSIRHDDEMIVLHSSKKNNKDLYIYQHRDDVENIIITGLQENKKVCVGFSCSVQSIKTLVRRPEFQGKKILIIHKDNRTLDVLNPEHWLDYDIVFYSPTISEGFSFELKHFDITCMLMSSQSCPPESVAQMVARIREAKEVHIHITLAQTSVKFHNDEQEIYTYYQKNIRELQQISTLNIDGVDDNFLPSIKKDMFWNLFVKNKLELGHDCNNFMSMVYQYLADNGYNIFQYNEIFTTDDEIKENKTIRGECKAQEKAYQNHSILTAPDIHIRDIPLLESKMNKTETDTFILTKADYKDILNVRTLNETHLEYKNHLGHMKHLKRLIILTRSIHNPLLIIRTPIRDIIEKHATSQFSSLARDSFDEQQDAVTNELWIRLKYLNNWCTTLGFRELFSNEELETELFQSRLTNLTQRYKQNKREWNYIQLLFNQKKGVNEWLLFLEQPDKFIYSKLDNVLGLAFVSMGGKTFQRLKYRVKLCRNPDELPCVMPHVLPAHNSEIIKLEDFFNRTSTYCNVCKKDLPSQLNEKHLTSKRHLAMLRGTRCEVCEKDFPKGIPEKHEESILHLRKLQQ